MKNLPRFFLLFTFFLPACTGKISTDILSTETATAFPSSGSFCGDGICEGLENITSCPADCTVRTGEVIAEGTTAGRIQDAPLYMTTMTHMEKGFNDDRDRNVFETHVNQLHFGMDLADEYGARLTVESEQPFARANTIWGTNIMEEILLRGHGVGTHCDFGFRDEVMPVEKYARFFAENKVLVDELVGAENNLGCSGGGGANDWALAASMAGFNYLDGIVGMHYLSMPLENRPDASWTNAYIREQGYHAGAPVDLDQRIYPFMVADAKDFIPDENGVILVSSGELSLMAAMEEGIIENPGSRLNDPPLTDEDVDTLVDFIQQVDHDRDRSRVAKLTVYIPVNAFVMENESVLRYFFSQLDLLAEQGVLEWATQKQVYESYVEWND